MKNKFIFLLLFTISVFGFVSCEKDDVPTETTPANSYILNYGDYSGTKGSISAFNTEKDTVTNNYFKAINGVDIVSNLQYAYQFRNRIYFMGNNADEIFFVDDQTFEQTENAISNDIVKPRYCVGKDDYLYVSCWGGDIWLDNTLSYIAKVNITTNKVEEKIELPGGAEGLTLVNNKIYAALNYMDSIAIIDLSTNTISYIETPTTSSYFLKDMQNNLYVSFVSYDPTVEVGLGYINTTTEELEATYSLPGISASYVNILAANSDFSKLYVMTSAYDDNWELTGAVATFDTNTKSFGSNLVEGISGMNGIAFKNDKVLCFVSENVTGNGSARSYNSDGTFVKEYETGIAPFMLLTVD